MSGYKIRFILYSTVETYREVILPNYITFIQLHGVIQRLFNFDDYHSWMFKIPVTSDDDDTINLANIRDIISGEDAEKMSINQVLEDDDVLLYEYDFGDSWIIIVHKVENVEYEYKKAVITDYKGKYSPMDDMGGIMVFEELMEYADNRDELLEAMEEYDLTKGDLTKMDFEKRHKIGTKFRIHNY